MRSSHQRPTRISAGAGAALACQRAVRHTLPAALLAGLLVLAPTALAQAPQAGAGHTDLPAMVQRPATATITPGAETSALEGLPIARVEVEGNQRTETRLILDQVRAQAGQPYHRQQVALDTRSIAALERFVSVKAEVVPTADHKVIVRFVVQERPVITALEIVGNHRKSTQEIRDLIQTQPGMAYDPFVIENDKKSIETFYKKDGYNFAHVSVDQNLLETQGVVKFVIEEGPRSRIASIRFDGNHHVPSDYLKWKIKSKTNFWFFRKGILNPDDIQQDVATIKEIYQNRAYLDARVSVSTQYSPDKKNITLRYAIVEGPHYTVRNITIKGNKVFTDAQLLANNPLPPGSFAEHDRIEALNKRINDAYGHEGYIYAQVSVAPKYTETPGTVDVDVTVDERGSYNVGQIIVRGNQNTQDRVIRRQIRIYPEQTYDTVKVQQSIDRLKATRIFSDVQITPIGGNQTTRDALVDVTEGQTGRFLIGAGVSTNAGLVGQVSIEQQNFDITAWPRSLGEFLRGQAFKGAGQYFRIMLEPGTEYQRYRVTFQEPYLFDTPYSLGNDAYYFTREQDHYDERRIGDILTLGRRFNDVWSVALAFRAEQVNISNIVDDGDNGWHANEQDAAQQYFDNEGSHFLTSIKPSVSRDTTDSRIFPTTGSRGTFGVEQYGAMGGAIDMTKLSLQFNWYTPLYTDLFDRNTVLALRNEVGAIVSGDSPFYERFYAGGIGSLRGFRYRGVSPRQGALRDAVGGDFMWVTTAEVNYPIYEDVVRGVVFVDVGTVEQDVSIHSIRSDIGAGVRLTLPFFGQLPIAIDFAYPVTKRKGDETRLVTFALGIPF
jgi:outer membrane protein insertion porin family